MPSAAQRKILQALGAIGTSNLKLWFAKSHSVYSNFCAKLGNCSLPIIKLNDRSGR